MRLGDLDALRNEVDTWGCNDYDKYDFIEAIDNTPTIEVRDNFDVGYVQGLEDGRKERPQGEWLIVGEEQGALGIIYKIRKCSKCGWEHSLVIPDNYCPNCGADMLEGDNKGLKKKELGVYANYDKCVPCVYMSFYGCTHPLKDDIGDVNGCVYFADVRKEIEDDI